MARKDSAQAAPSDVVDCEVPDWMGCDLSVCRVLQDTSMQIAANIRALGKQLHGACGQATACLPAPEPGGEAPFGCADECFTFLRAFDALSGALLLLAGDLELGVAAPLQKTILTLQEESSGRTKHWQQVRRRFAELQERYRRSQRKSMEARRSLEGSAVGDAGGWFAGRSRASAPSTRAASEQHAALCELARCEEELLRSEASLRSFEDESRERLVQLNLEKWQRMGEALSQGASSLRRLLPAITGKDAPDQEAPAWKGVIPPSGAPLESKAAQGCASPLPSSVSGGAAAPAPLAAPATPAPASRGSAAARAGGGDPAGDRPEAGPSDPSLKYLRGPGAPRDFQDVDLGGGLSDEEAEAEPELDAVARAAVWSPQVARQAAGGCPRRPKSLVFASSGGSLVARSRSALERTPQRSATTPGRLGSPGSSPQDRPSGGHVAGVSPLTLSKLAEFQGGLFGAASSSARASPSAPAASAHGASAPPTSEEVEWAAVPEAGPGVAGAGAAGAVTPSSSPRPSLEAPRRAPLGAAHAEELHSDSTSSEEVEVQGAVSAAVPPQPPPEKVKLQLSPLVAESPQRCFEKYAQRLGERLSCATICRWDRLQAAANEQLAGGHVGKLECFWIHEPGAQPCPEAASGLVCFQFVQGHSSNFVRVLHLSAVGGGPPGSGREAAEGRLLSAAVREARGLIFGALPADSLRAVVLVGEDEEGRLYVDADVEAAYQGCGFRWFQLTQCIRRSRSAFRAAKIKPSLRFLVFSAHRGPTDPPRPSGGLQPLSALLLRSDEDATARAEAQAAASGESISSFTAW